jgi:hypothetical protein
MAVGITQGHGFYKRMKAQAHNDPYRHAVMQVMGVAVLHSERDEVQPDLQEKPRQDQTADEQSGRPVRGIVVMVEIRQQMQEGKTEQVGPGESVEELHMARLVEFEDEDAKRAESDAGEE